MDRDKLLEISSAAVGKLKIIWWPLLFVSLFVLLHPFAGRINGDWGIAVKVSRINNVKDLFFIFFALAVIAIFFVKKMWLSYRVLEGMVANKKDLSKTWGLPLTPMDDELATGGGVIYHVRKTITLVLFILWILVLATEAYYIYTGDRGNLFVYSVIILFSILLNYPQKKLFKNLCYMIKEAENDTQ